MAPKGNSSAERRARAQVQRKDDGNAFIPDPEGGASHTEDSLAEGLAETYIESATSGEEQGEDMMNALVSEELGGPFLEEEALFDSDEPITLRRKRQRPSTPSSRSGAPPANESDVPASGSDAPAAGHKHRSSA